MKETWEQRQHEKDRRRVRRSKKKGKKPKSNRGSNLPHGSFHDDTWSEMDQKWLEEEMDPPSIHDLNDLE